MSRRGVVRLSEQELAMDRSLKKKHRARLLVACILGTLSGCVANPMQVPTIWDKLGVTGATARLRDATINRNGNFPGLESKPPLLKLADPANLAPEKPEVIKAAAKIKQDQDLKKQKVKAIKFLAEVGCGCYNKDDAVAKALLEALGDCDPDVKKAAIEAISQNAGACNQCRSGCETTCCSEEIIKKLQDMATGMDDHGCFNEPDRQIRSLAAAAARACPVPRPKPIEEVPAPDEIEEVPPTYPELEDPERPSTLPDPERSTGRGAATGSRKEGVTKVSFSSNATKVVVEPKSSTKNSVKNAVAYPSEEDGYGTGAEPVNVVKRKGKDGELISGIANPDQLIQATLVSHHKQSREVVVELPDFFQLATDSNMVFVDAAGNYQVGKVNLVRGRKIHVEFEEALALRASKGTSIRIGLLGN